MYLPTYFFGLTPKFSIKLILTSEVIKGLIRSSEIFLNYYIFNLNLRYYRQLLSLFNQKRPIIKGVYISFLINQICIHKKLEHLY